MQNIAPIINERASRSRNTLPSPSRSNVLQSEGREQRSTIQHALLRTNNVPVVRTETLRINPHRRGTSACSTTRFMNVIPPHTPANFSQMGTHFVPHNRQEHRRATSATRWTSREYSNQSKTPVSQHRVWKREEMPSAGEKAKIRTASTSTSTSTDEPLDVTPAYVIRLVVHHCKNRQMTLAEMNFVSQPTFLNHLVEYISRLPNNKEINVAELVNDITIFCQNILNLMPSKVFEIVHKLVTETEKVILHYETHQQFSIDKKIKNNFSQLCIWVSEIRIRWEARKANICRATGLIQQQKNFRKVKVFPSADDILADSSVPDDMSGDKKCNAMDTYLGQQFFKFRYKHIIKPLHNSVLEYLDKTIFVKHATVSHIMNVRFYRNVTLLYPTCTKNKIGVIIHFDPSQHVEQINSSCEKFIFGSLLVFTSNNFFTLILGTVLESNEDDVKRGHVEVELIAGQQYSDSLFDVEYTMAETDVYFKPLCNVSKALQEKRKDDFPFIPYIISGKKEIHFQHLELSKEFSNLNLDPVQLQCLKLSLSGDLVLISGAHGTGKTYLGIKILQALLKCNDQTPILVICKTSNVLDKFLLGVSRFTTRLVRIGGACPNERLADFTLDKMRSKDCPPMLTELKLCKAANTIIFQRIQQELEMLSQNKGVISLTNLKMFGQMDGRHLKQFYHYKFNEESIFYSWLVCEMLFGRNIKLEVMPDIMEINRRAETSKKVEKVMQFDENSRRQLEEALENEPPQECVHSRIKYIETIANLEREKKRIKETVAKLQENWTGEQDISEERDVLRNKMRNISIKLNRFTKRLQHNSGLAEADILYEGNLFGFYPDDRWRLYWHWVHNLKCNLMAQLKILKEQLEEFVNKINQYVFAQNCAILREACIVGVTIDKAVDLRLALNEVRPKRVMVLDATDISEAHTVAALPGSCQHLVLIGQEHTLESEDESLLGRLLAAGVTNRKLITQHRMRPEIAQLTSTVVDPINTAGHFRLIGGIASSIYFILHNIAQVGSAMDSPHEADFLLALCKYILLQGYRALDISILSFHASQAVLLQHECNKSEMLKEVHVDIVDNCRGLESEIVLLSLVGTTALPIAESYKVKLALTRARAGLYIIGHSDILTEAQSPWHDVCKALRGQNAIGEDLHLVCQTHPKQKTLVRRAQDFSSILEGGCNLLCDAMLPCGHTCQKVCHMTDREHIVYQCHRPCDRTCSSHGHKCQLQCWEDCTLCMQQTLKILSCGHKITVPCHQEVKSYKCQTGSCSKPNVV